MALLNSGEKANISFLRPPENTWTLAAATKKRLGSLHLASEGRDLGWDHGAAAGWPRPAARGHRRQHGPEPGTPPSDAPSVRSVQLLLTAFSRHDFHNRKIHLLRSTIHHFQSFYGNTKLAPPSRPWILRARRRSLAPTRARSPFPTGPRRPRAPAPGGSQHSRPLRLTSVPRGDASGATRVAARAGLALRWPQRLREGGGAGPREAPAQSSSSSGARAASEFGSCE